jgi:hypothetical protein
MAGRNGLRKPRVLRLAVSSAPASRSGTRGGAAAASHTRSPQLSSSVLIGSRESMVSLRFCPTSALRPALGGCAGTWRPSGEAGPEPGRPTGWPPGRPGGAPQAVPEPGRPSGRPSRRPECTPGGPSGIRRPSGEAVRGRSRPRAGLAGTGHPFPTPWQEPARRSGGGGRNPAALADTDLGRTLGTAHRVRALHRVEVHRVSDLGILHPERARRAPPERRRAPFGPLSPGDALGRGSRTGQPGSGRGHGAARRAGTTPARRVESAIRLEVTTTALRGQPFQGH